MVRDRGKSLAARIRAGIEAKEDELKREKAEAKARAKRLHKEREILLQDLLRFGEAIGHLTVQMKNDRLQFNFGKKQMRFEAIGNADCLRVTGGDLPENTEIVMQEELSLWIVKSPVGASAQQQDVLFDTGLEWLMDLGLGLR